VPENDAPSVGALLVAAFVLVACVPLAAGGAVDLRGLETATSGGLETVDRSLARLEGSRRLLVVGAHPDDEDNALLTYVARGLGGEAAYLSLSRGEGGQNLIGRELGVDLGVVRTGELLAARRIEGTRQYFTRALDFGYTRSLDETFQRWPREELRIDALRVARRFRPQVVVSVFPESERARHGQHHAAAVIARDIYELAGDPDEATVLLDEGLDPWRPRALYRRAWGQDEATAHYSLGSLDSLSGRSLGQIAAASRSQHRSQDMGRELSIGRFPGGLTWLAGGAGEASRDVFSGIDTRLATIADSVTDEKIRDRVAELLDGVEHRARRLRRALTVHGLDEAVVEMATITARLADAERLARSAGATAAAELVAEKRVVAETALVAAAGVVMDATSNREEIVIGEGTEIEIGLWRAGLASVEVGAARLVSDAGWNVEAAEYLGRDERTAVDHWTSKVRVPAGARPSQPYYLEQPLAGDLYDWIDTRPDVRGHAFQLPPVTAVVTVAIEGIEVEIRRDVVYRYADQAVGEIRRPLRAVPTVEIAVAETLKLWPRESDERATLEVILRSNSEEPITGVLEIEAPSGWSIQGRSEFEINEPRGSVVRSLDLVPSRALEVGRQVIPVRAVLSNGQVAAASYPLVEYPHVPPTPIGRSAEVELSVFDLELPAERKVGYIPGAADRVPDVLRAVGVPLSLLDDEDLAVGDLTAFDVIVVGSRAYETNAALRQSNRRLVAFVEQGGTLVVQYQQYQFIAGNYAPLALEIARPHGRVTDETAPVHVLEPDHAVFSRPNLIGESDWQGWVQERGLYFPFEWDERFLPLLSMSDPGREPERGALLAAEVGNGLFVYTGLSFFRQLPAGVP
jgi:LmbE family N-acetylglucosaminyl deacetylase